MGKQQSAPVKVLAELFDLTETRIQQLAKDNIIPKAGRGKYEIIPCFQGYTKFLQEKLRGKDSDSVDSKKEKGRLLKLQADEKEMKILTDKGLLLSIHDVKDMLSELISICAMGLESIPGRMATQLAGISEPAEIQKVLFEEIRTIRQSTASGIREFAGAEENIADPGGNNGRAPAKKSGSVGGRKHGAPKRKRGAGKNKAKAKNAVHAGTAKSVHKPKI